MKLSVVLTTFNRAECLKQNLNCFLKQTDMDFELIVSMDGCTDDTELILKEYKKICPFELTWLDTGLQDTYGLAKARNQGILASSGEAVVILDDDSFPTPQFIKEHKRTVKRKTLTGGYRNSHFPRDIVHLKLIVKMKLLMIKYYLHKYTNIDLYNIKSMIENNCCMYREDWINSKLFSEKITYYGGIGQEFTKRLAEQGYKYQFNPLAMIYHHGEYADDYGLTRSEKILQAKNNKNF